MKNWELLSLCLFIPVLCLGQCHCEEMTLSPTGPREIVTPRQRVTVNCTLLGENVFKNLGWTVFTPTTSKSVFELSIRTRKLIHRPSDMYISWLGYNTLQLVIPAFYGVHNGVYACHSRGNQHYKFIELETQKICGADSFRCHSGECKLRRHKCDNFFNCADASDEIGCGGPSTSSWVTKPQSQAQREPIFDMLNIAVAACFSLMFIVIVLSSMYIVRARARARGVYSGDEQIIMGLNNQARRPHIRAVPHEYVSLTEQRLHNIQLSAHVDINITSSYSHPVSLATSDAPPSSYDQTVNQRSSPPPTYSSAVAVTTAGDATVAVETADDSDNSTVDC